MASKGQAFAQIPLKTIFTAASVEEFNQFRTMIESGNAGLAALQCSDASSPGIRALQQLNDEGEAAVAAGDYDALIDVDFRFHQTVASLTDNSVMKAIVTIMMESWIHVIRHNFNHAVYTQQDIIGKIIPQHRIITDAIASADKHLAKRSMEEHLQTVTHSASLRMERKDIFVPNPF